MRAKARAPSDAFRRATTLDPRYARAWSNLGNALARGGPRAESREAFERAVEVDPRYAFGWTHVAIARRDDGDDAGAAAAARARARARRSPAHRAPGARRDRPARRAGSTRRSTATASALDAQPGDARSRFLLRRGARRARRSRRRAHGVRARGPRRSRAAPREPGGGADAADGRARRRRRGALARGVRRRPRRSRRTARARGGDGRRRVCSTSCAGPISCSPTRARTIARCRPRTAISSPRPCAPGAYRRASPRSRRRARCAWPSSRRSSATGPPAAISSRGSPGLPRERFDVAVHFLGSGSDALTERLRARADASSSTAPICPPRSRRRSRRPRRTSSSFRSSAWTRTTFALAALQARAAPARRLGTPGHERAPTIDAMLTAGADGARGRGRALPRAARAAARARHALRAGPARPRGRPRRRSACRRRAAVLLPAVAVQAASGQRRAGRRGPRGDRRPARRVRGPAPEAHARMARALDRALEARGVARDRVVVRPQVGHDDYLALCAACDAMLDSVRWSGGNTSLDAIACALPVVTLPGAYMRARQSAAMLAAGRRAGARRARRGRLRRDRDAARLRPRVARRRCRRASIAAPSACSTIRRRSRRSRRRSRRASSIERRLAPRALDRGLERARVAIEVE
jgi:hypothetical protein